MKNKVIIVILISLLMLAIVAASEKVEKDNKIKEDLERIDIIHYAKPDHPGNSAKTENCYKLMGVKWNSLPVNYVINPSNPQGLSETFITSAISASAETWDAATSAELFNDTYNINYTAQYGVQDFKNAIVFGNYPQQGVIGITSVWISKRSKQIVEFDILLDTDFAWGDATINPSVMDLQNIATHELGHSVGLSDVYATICSEVTMYGYSSYGETKERTLETPDITGLQKMYG